MTETAWLWLYVAAWRRERCCSSPGAAIRARCRNTEYAAAIVIPVWSGLAYAAMALDQGILEIAGREVYLARYLDWLVTTPLLLFLLSSTGMFFRPLDKTTIGTLVALDVIMILSGLFADLSVREDLRWFWYVTGCVCLALIVSIIWGRVRREAYAHNKEIGDAYTRVLIYFTVLWLGYPTVWALGPSGVGLLGGTTEVALFVILPIFSKVGFSIYDLHELRKLAPRFPEFDDPDARSRLRSTPT